MLPVKKVCIDIVFPFKFDSKGISGLLIEKYVGRRKEELNEVRAPFSTHICQREDTAHLIPAMELTLTNISSLFVELIKLGPGRLSRRGHERGCRVLSRQIATKELRPSCRNLRTVKPSRGRHSSDGIKTIWRSQQ